VGGALVEQVFEFYTKSSFGSIDAKIDGAVGAFGRLARVHRLSCSVF
jgi:hypothetical protein